ncbi:hypothetical protein A3A68_01070 [Candidatus Saccharibacteria bacterium RIFCSPLOWO2_01_FULL_48_13]|nr:MAG: hypothetical protein A2884_01570 [Candidatus Saccharibacteria bacterium RIFCSPHIGHO2_01_FULL_48_12]OGL35453.1 MAG: hypothetical protein A3F38_02675 [Candidatus Saccharibacteria bacterium RIFCSPHIGHO2_12_FULL_48_21]OGL37030.1 MAG: hypothetical protein A3A68_01070 [Candidatus Saccharibacteria bacterium RIFCSPLOWO2_01_FULL_48_13]
MPMAVVIGFLFIGALSAFVYFQFRKEPSKPIVTLESASPLKAKDVKISSSLQFAKDGDTNKDGKFNGGDAVKFSFTLNNVTQNGGKFTTLDTGIPTKYIYYLRSITGSTGYDKGSGTIKFKNIIVYPSQTQAVSFEANLVYSTSDVDLAYTPTLTDQANREIAKGNTNSQFITKVAADATPSQINVIKEEN